MYTDSIAEFLRQLGLASVQASGLAVFVWLACAFLGRHLAPRWRCWLWNLVIIRLAWPFHFQSYVSVFNLWTFPKRFSPTDWMQCYLPEELSNAANAWLSRPWVCWLWLGVAAFLTIRVVIAWIKSVWLRKCAKPTNSKRIDRLVRHDLSNAGIKTPVPVCESDRVQSPCLVGWWHPQLLFPRGLLDELTERELQLTVSHEIAHIRRRDIPMNWMLAVVEAFHWFNPLVWLVSRELRSAREEACDAYALALNPGTNRSYGETVLKILERSSLPLQSKTSTMGVGTIAIVGEKNTAPSALHQRMRAIASHRPGTRTWIVGACTWLALACIGLTEAEPQSVPENLDQVATVRPTLPQPTFPVGQNRSLNGKPIGLRIPYLRIPSDSDGRFNGSGKCRRSFRRMRCSHTLCLGNKATQIQFQSDQADFAPLHSGRCRRSDA